MPDGVDWVANVMTVTASVIGGGGLVTVVQTYLNNRREERKETRTDIQAFLMERVKELEKRNEEITALEKEKLELEKELVAVREALIRAETFGVVAVVTANAMMEICRWNVGAIQIFGYLESEIIGKSVSVLVPGNLKQRHLTGYEAAVNDHDSVIQWDKPKSLVGVHKDGREMPLLISVSSYQTGGGEKFFEARISRGSP